MSDDILIYGPPMPATLREPEIADIFFAELTRRIDLSKLHPVMAGKLRRLLAHLEDRASRFYPTSGLRSVDEQNALYAKGRDANGKVIDPKGKGIVTKVKGGFSYHNYGIAVDLCHDLDADKPGLQPDYAARSYDVLGEAAAAVGLEWGGSWEGFQDRPHVQLPLKSKGLKIDDLFKLYRKGGMAAVWARLDQEDWG